MTLDERIHYKTSGSIFRDAYLTELLQVNTLCSTENISMMLCVSGPGSTVGIATGYGLGGLGIESR